MLKTIRENLALLSVPTLLSFILATVAVFFGLLGAVLSLLPLALLGLLAAVLSVTAAVLSLREGE
jgi:hypothetical protein